MKENNKYILIVYVSLLDGHGHIHDFKFDHYPSDTEINKSCCSAVNVEFSDDTQVLEGFSEAVDQVDLLTGDFLEFAESIGFNLNIKLIQL